MSGAPKYILTERIAQGGMAEIHLGKSVGLDGFARVCAFKRILPHFAQDQEFIQMFRNEAMVAKQLQNKNIVQVFDFASDGTSYMLVMEFVDGQDLRAVLASSEQQRKRIPTEIAVFLVIEVLSGLSYAHGAVDVQGKVMGIIHRDVSPQNILISFEGDIKITDFGIAKAQNQQSTTRAGVLKGKFRYMSPEQAMGQAIDSRSDVFAIGVILWEMLTMQRLFKGEDMAVLESVRQCKIKPPSQVAGAKVPPELDAIVMKLLAKDVSKRYATAKEAIRDLNKFLYGARPDFFAGEVAEFMHTLFRDRIATARERLRSTLALPVGALGAGASFDMFGAGSDPRNAPSSVVDMSKPAARSPGAQVPMAGGQAARAASGGAPNLNDAMNDPQRRANAPGAMNRLEVVGGRNVGSKDSGGSGGDAAGGESQTQVQRGRQGAKPRLRSARFNVSRTNTSGYSEGVGSETILIMAVVFAIGLGLGYFALLKMGVLNKTSEVSVEVTPSNGRFLVTLDGAPQFKNQHVTSPFRLPLVGNKEYTLVIRKLGFKDKSFVLRTPLFGGHAKETLILEKSTTPMISIRVATTPPGGQAVLENGMGEGQTPTTFPYLPIGRQYEIVVTHPKCQGTLRDRVVLKAGDERREVITKTFKFKNCRK